MENYISFSSKHNYIIKDRVWWGAEYNLATMLVNDSFHSSSDMLHMHQYLFKLCSCITQL